ncbi:Dephospho-CoA kinase [Sporomusa carbonis]|uniref:dephospho-CoA kinase n=1 Tax=Sporomusa carbonis TaxID=3076075 RepID=UPI003A5DA304
MYLIGLTGGIASGKSTVSTLLKELGAYIVDADKLSREVTCPGKPAWQDIVARFGRDIIGADGEIDRRRLGQLVFADSQARVDLERITHPRIKDEAKAAIADAKQRGYKVIVLDVPLLIEAGWHNMVDAVWVVYVDENTQVARLMARDNINYDDAMARIKSQLSLKEKLKYATVVLNNNNTIESTKEQVYEAWRGITLKEDSVI